MNLGKYLWLNMEGGGHCQGKCLGVASGVNFKKKLVVELGKKIIFYSPVSQ